MTKQELYNALVQKYDTVEAVNEWKLTDSLNNIKGYRVRCAKLPNGFYSFVVIVKDEGLPAETISHNAIIEVAPAAFSEQVLQKIEEYKTAGTIEAGIIESIGKEEVTAKIYRDVNNVIVEERWLAYLDTSDVLQLKKVG